MLMLVRVLLLQGKATRGAVLKGRPLGAKKPLKPRAAAISLDRKENLAQPGCSKSGGRLNKCFKAKSRKDLTLKSKNAAAADKAAKAGAVKGKRAAGGGAAAATASGTAAKLQSIREGGPDKAKKEGSDAIHLREICFIKNAEGKTVIAKYQNKEDSQFDDNLVVSWSAATSKPHIFTQKTRVSSAPPYACGGGGKGLQAEAGPSRQPPAFRVHNFTKGSSKGKLKKHPLRRLASATDALGKIDKAKKKKLKAK